MLLQNKRAVIFGISNKHSIGWSIAKNMILHGCVIPAIVIQNERFLSNIESLLGMDPSRHDTTLSDIHRKNAENQGIDPQKFRPNIIVADVNNNRELDDAFDKIQKTLSNLNASTGNTASTPGRNEKFDILCHCIAHSPTEAMKAKSILDVSPEDFSSTMRTSAWVCALFPLPFWNVASAL